MMMTFKFQEENATLRNFEICSNVCFIKIRSKLISVLLHTVFNTIFYETDVTYKKPHNFLKFFYFFLQNDTQRTYYRQSPLFKDLTKHLNDFHVNGIREIPMLVGNVWMAKLEDNLRNFENYGDDEESNWPPKKIINTDGAVFFLEALMTEIGFYCWANFLGSSDDAKVRS